MSANLVVHPSASTTSQGRVATTLQSVYEGFAEISTAMLDAAERGDWDAVTAGEQSCGQLVDFLHQSRLVPIDDAERVECMRLVRKVLADDAAIRGLAQPWLQELDKILRPATGRLRTHSFR
jgi:flagellar protein FliT